MMKYKPDWNMDEAQARKLLEEDEAARERIRRETDKNFFVEASAGSGKTTMLVDRMVAMVEAGTDISKICAITFTKAAANEFYFRFQDKLGEAARQGSQRAKEALKNLDLCFMGTIDAFCQMILSEHPMEAAVPTGNSLLQDEDLSAEYERVWLDLTRGRYPEYNEQFYRWTTYCRKAKNAFVQALDSLMKIRNTGLKNRLETRLAGEALAPVKADLIRILRFLKDHQAEACYLDTERRQGDDSSKKGNPRDDSLKNRWDKLDSEIIPAFDADWEKNLEGILELFNTWGSDEGKTKGKIIKITPAFYEKTMKEGKYDLSLYFRPDYEVKYVIDIDKKEKEKKALAQNTEVDEQKESGDKEIRFYGMCFDLLVVPAQIRNFQFAYLMGLVQPQVERVAKDLRQQGKLSFFDYLLYLRDMLKADAAGDGSLTRHIYERHSYFLIDEFQDTNPLQSEVFFYLTAENPCADWKCCLPRPGSLFIVGDPKQSIYRFRQADVVSFLDLKKLFEQGVGEVVYLTRNFRSTRQLCQWYNEIFTEIFPESGLSDTQSSYEPIPLKGELADESCMNGIFSYVCSSSNSTKVLESEKSPAKVSAMIRQMVHNPQVKISVPVRDEKGKITGWMPRELEYGDFMLIPWAKTTMPAHMEEFRMDGIPFRIEGRVEFNQCEAFGAMCWLMEAAANPNAYKRNDYIQEHIYFKASDRDLKESLQVAKGLSPAAAFGYLLEKEKVLERYGSDRLEYVYYARELLRQHEAEGKIKTLSEASDYLKSLLKIRDTDVERNMALTPEENCVHFANLHKIKGLEAPVVVLIGANTKVFPASSHVDYRHDPPCSVLFRVSEKDEEGNEKRICGTGEYLNEMGKELLLSREEDDRKCYVAATRAENVLIIGHCEADSLDPWEKLKYKEHPDIFKDYLVTREKKPSRKKGNSEVSAADLYQEAEEQVLITSEKSRKKTLQMETESWSYTKESPSKLDKEKSERSPAQTDEDGTAEDIDLLPENDSGEVTQEKTGSGKRDAHLIGTMVHRLMECLVLSRGKYAGQGEVLIRQVLAEQKAEADPYFRDILEEVLEKILGGGYEQPSGFPRDILAELRGAQEVHCELPFCYQEVKDGETILWHGIMDLVYQKDGKWYIIDYKTNRDNEDLEKDYESQLAQYKKAFKELSGEDAQTRIYSIPV